jgi:glycosyltransferase involved in cell wall biosynthesis
MEAVPAHPLRVALVMDGSGKGYGVFRVTLALAASADRTCVTPVGLFLGPGHERDVVGRACAESCELGCGCLLPLSKPGRSKWNLPNLVRKAVTFMRAVRDLARAIRRLRIDVVHVHFYPLHLVAGLASRAAGVPCLWHWHGPFQYEGIRGSLARWGFRRLATRIICISKFVAETLPQDVRHKALVIYNGVDAARIAPEQRHGALRARVGVPADCRLVGLFGSISERKGHEYFIRAAAEVLKRLPEVRFAIVGSEMEVCRLRYGLEARYRRLAAELGLRDRMIFAAHLEEGFLYMADCDIICMPTVPIGLDTGEGFGLVMVEAMAAGVPVIATRCGAPPEVIEDGVSGILVPPRDAQALAAAMLRLLQDEPYRQAVGLAGQRRVARDFDIRRTAAAMEELYREVAAGRQSNGLPAPAAQPERKAEHS